MPAPIFIGDEVSASAWRLGGARVRVPAGDDPAPELAWACREAELVLITAALAARLPADELARRRAGLRPLVLVVPDIRARVAVPDLARWVRARLGLEG